MKSLKTALCALVLAGFAMPAAAFEPERPECIAPANPGGGFDLTCRVAQRALEPALPSPMEVTFMPGGIGAVAYAHMNSNRRDRAPVGGSPVPRRPGHVAPPDVPRRARRHAHRRAARAPRDCLGRLVQLLPDHLAVDTCSKQLAEDEPDRLG